MHKISIFLIYLCLNFMVILACSNRHKQNKEQENTVFSIDSLFSKANNLYKLKDYKRSLIIYNELIVIDSMRGDFYFKRGNCKAQLNDYEGSSKDYLKTIDLNCRIEDSYFNLGCNYASIIQDSLALKYFNLAYQLDTSDISIKMQIEFIKDRMNRKK